MPSRNIRSVDTLRSTNTYVPAPVTAQQDIKPNVQPSIESVGMAHWGSAAMIICGLQIMFVSLAEGYLILAMFGAFSFVVGYLIMFVLLS